MMRQFLDIKAEYKDAILFFRLGDFYEMFFEDAKIASAELELTLTGRGKDEARVPMCGVPYHAAENYINKLIDKGYKVAICEQVEDPPEGKGITKREVVRVLTPATHVSDANSDTQSNLYLAAICSTDSEAYGLSIADCTTGEFKCCVVPNKERLDQILARLSPKEILVPSLDTASDYDALCTPYIVQGKTLSLETFKHFFNITSLDSFGLSGHEDAVPAATAILDYLAATQKHALTQLSACTLYRLDNSMGLDTQTIRNLELFQTLHKQDKTETLFWVLNRSKTSMGARMLKQWLLHPLTCIDAIEERHHSVAALKQDLLSREEIREQLQQIYDIERLLTRIVSQTHNPRDLIGLKQSLEACYALAGILEHVDSPLLNKSCSFFNDLQRDSHPFRICINLIESAINDPAPANLRSGSVIKPGYSDELDTLLQSFKDIKDWIGSLEAKEQERTGIKTLRVGFNKVFGYYFQVSKGQTDHVPTDYIRKQTLTNAERYITPELKEKETILLHGEEKQMHLEQKLYEALVQDIAKHTLLIQEAARHIALLDCLQSYATVAQQNNYSQPRLTTHAHTLSLTRSRHPVLEKKQPHNTIENDLTLSNADYMLLITGPNMAGKSTLMKQVALTVIMAQAGSFVPADEAIIGLVDRCFTRIGASDNLADGQSTFMVEMTETATIVHNATEKSLILLDEIGRGTSTYDGMSIAGAVMQHIHEHIRARTLFATHYHELTSMDSQFMHLKNVSMAIEEDNGKLAFTYKLKHGPADKSYGIHVAQMAGLPEGVIQRAQQLLDDYEKMPVSSGQLALF